MTRAHRKDGAIRVVQSKTGEDLDIGASRAGSRAGDGRAYEPAHHIAGQGVRSTLLGAWFADAIDKAGLADDCVLHGLRKTAAKRLAEAGCSEEQIKAVPDTQPAGWSPTTPRVPTNVSSPRPRS